MDWTYVWVWLSGFVMGAAVGAYVISGFNDFWAEMDRHWRNK